MRKRMPVLKLGLATGLLAVLTACGLESLLVDAITGEPEVVVVEPGTLTVNVPDFVGNNATVYLFDLEGNELVKVEAQANAGGAFVFELPAEAAVGTLRVVVVSGNIVLKNFLFCLGPEDLETEQTVDVTVESTAGTLLAEALGNELGTPGEGEQAERYSVNAYALASYAPDELQKALDAITAGATAGSGEAFDFYTLVEEVIAAGSSSSGGTPMFVPAVNGETILQAEFVEASGLEGITAEEFNAAAAGLAASTRTEIDAGLQAAQYTDTGGASHRLLTVIFTAHIGDGLQNGNCAAIDLCGKSIRCDDGDTLFFTGGVHEDSPIQDPDLHALLGGFIPNTLPMHDDGLNGDEVADDDIFTIVFQLPEGLRIGYKYTYGRQGEGWSGTEEWPGNQRILEIVDNNGDGYVWRDDNVTDEATNKDKFNLYGGQSGGVVIEWDTDLNGDGIPEAQEHPISVEVLDEEANLVRLAGQCTYDLYVYPTRVPRATAGTCE